MADYQTITVAAGERYTKHLSNGEVWENKLIDITAPGAEYFISARANNWTIRNVGIKGAMPSHREINPFRVEVPNPNATGVIENLYLGDGDEGTYAKDGAQISGIWAVWTHAGTIECRNLHLSGFSDGNFYCSAPGNSNDHPNPGGGGTFEIYDSYSTNGDISNWRVGTDGSFLDNCVSWGGTHRGLKQPYNSVELIDCDFGAMNDPTPIDVGSNNWNAGRGATTVVMGTRFNDANVVEKNTSKIIGESAGEPVHRVPDGVPMTPEMAASGGGVAAEDATADEAPPDGPAISADAHLVTFLTAENASGALYDIWADGRIAFTKADYTTPSGNPIEGGTWEARDAIDHEDGVWHAAGGTGGGYGDALLVDGAVLDVQVHSDDMWIELDGERVTGEELVERTAPDDAGGGESTDGSDPAPPSSGRNPEGEGGENTDADRLTAADVEAIVDARLDATLRDAMIDTTLDAVDAVRGGGK